MSRSHLRSGKRRSRQLGIEALEGRQMFAALADVSHDPFVGRQYYLDSIEAPAAWETATGENVVVAVIDSGVDVDHPDLRNNIWTNPREIPNNGLDDDGNGVRDDIRGYDFGNGDADPTDRKGHGTHMAGIIAAEKDNGVGIAGVAPDAKIMPLRISRTERGREKIDWQAAIRAIDYVTDMRLNHGVNVRVIAFSGITDRANLPGTPLPALRDAIERAGQAGILFVTSAGNYRVDNDQQTPYPASYDPENIISVAASDQRDRYWRNSNHGETTVDLAAPGSRISSTYPNRTSPVTKSGTSFAAPQVAGVAALLFSANPNATAAEVKQAILLGADPMNDPRKDTVSDGRLNAQRSLAIITGRESPPPTDTPQPTPPTPPTPPTAAPDPPQAPTDPPAPAARLRTHIEVPRSVRTRGTIDVEAQLIGSTGGSKSPLAGKELVLWLRVPMGRGQIRETTDRNSHH